MKKESNAVSTARAMSISGTSFVVTNRLSEEIPSTYKWTLVVGGISAITAFWAVRKISTTKDGFAAGLGVSAAFMHKHLSRKKK